MHAITTSRLLLALGLGALLLAAGCGGSEQPPANGPSGGSETDATGDGANAAGAGGEIDRTGWPSVVRVGVVPTEGGEDLTEKFEPIENHLEARLGVDFVFTSASSYAAVITEMAGGGFEFAYFGPYSYVEAARRAGAEAILVELNTDNEPGYNSILITREDSGIETIEDAKGKRFSFTNPKSTSGYLVPKVLFFQARGIDPATYFRDFNANGTGNHRASILAVQNGDLDLASTNNLDLGRVTNPAESGLRIIWTSPTIPGAPFAAARGLSPSLRAAFIEAMKDFRDEAALAALNAGGYIETDDSAYDPVRELEAAGAGG